MSVIKPQRLNKIGNLLYTAIILAIDTDILSGQAHAFIFTISTGILVMGIAGIIAIEFIKLQWKQNRNNKN